jgi:hypothetical protein
LLQAIVDKKDKEIKRLNAKLKEFELALRIPREHFKLSQNFRLEELFQ